jgi:hypothetical protein
MNVTDEQLKIFCEKNPHLVSIKQSERYPDLSVVKYKRKVFYDNLWTPELMELRGLVIDRDWNVIVRPFTKVFNRGERGTDIPLDMPVIAVRKVNGFMAAVTNTKKYGVIVSTTGSLDSPFVDMAKEMLPGWCDAQQLMPHRTHLFEICHPNDPHIVTEQPGAYLIGIRYVYSGYEEQESELDDVSTMRPEWKYCLFRDVLEMSKTCKHEGYMVRAVNGAVLKLKSPYYLTKKFFARVNSNKLTPGWLVQNKHTFEEEFYPLIDNILENLEKFQALDETQRKQYIEDYLNG